MADVSEPFRYEFRENTLFLHHINGEGAYRIDPWPVPRTMVRLLPDGQSTLQILPAALRNWR